MLPPTPPPTSSPHARHDPLCQRLCQPTHLATHGAARPATRTNQLLPRSQACRPGVLPACSAVAPAATLTRTAPAAPAPCPPPGDPAPARSVLLRTDRPGSATPCARPSPHLHSGVASGGG